MTLAAASSITSYIGNGGASAYAFTFPVFLQTHLTVTVYNPSAPTVPILLNLGTDYTVSGLSATGAPAQTGTITLVSGGQQWLTGGNLTTAWVITIARVMPLAQNTSIRNQGDFFRYALEDALDNLAMQIQQLQQQISAPVVPTNFTFPGDVTVTGGGFGFVVTDQVTGKQYRLMVQNGVFAVQEVT